MNELAQLANSTGVLERIAEQLDLQDDPALAAPGWSAEWLATIDSSLDASGKKFFANFAAKSADCNLRAALRTIQTVADQFVALGSAAAAAADGTFAIDAFLSMLPLAALRSNPKPIVDALASLEAVMAREYYAIANVLRTMVNEDAEDKTSSEYQFLDVVFARMCALIETLATLAAGDLALLSDSNAYAERLADIERQVVEMHADTQPERYEVARGSLSGPSPLQLAISQGRFSISDIARFSAARNPARNPARSQSPGRGNPAGRSTKKGEDGDGGDSVKTERDPQQQQQQPQPTSWRGWLGYAAGGLALLSTADLAVSSGKFLMSMFQMFRVLGVVVGVLESPEITALRYIVGIGESVDAEKVDYWVRFFLGWQEVIDNCLFREGSVLRRVTGDVLCKKTINVHQPLLRTYTQNLWATLAYDVRQLYGVPGIVIGVLLVIAFSYYRHRAIADELISTAMPALRDRTAAAYKAIGGLVPSSSSTNAITEVRRTTRVTRPVSRIRSITPEGARDPRNAN